MNNLFRVPGECCPYHIDCVTYCSLVPAPIQPVIAFEMSDKRLDLYPLPEGFPEPGFLVVWMGILSFLGYGYALNSPSPPAILLLF